MCVDSDGIVWVDSGDVKDYFVVDFVGVVGDNIVGIMWVDACDLVGCVCRY